MLGFVLKTNTSLNYTRDVSKHLNGQSSVLNSQSELV